MVHGKDKDQKLAMQERERQDFHTEFSMMRITPLKEIGEWNGTSGYTGLNPTLKPSSHS